MRSDVRFIVKTDKNVSTIALFTKCARLNHNCLPNTYASWNTTNNQEALYAIRNIGAGQALTISYEETVGGDSIVRRNFLEQRWKFTSVCRTCVWAVSHPDHLKASDLNFRAINRLEPTIAGHRSKICFSLAHGSIRSQKTVWRIVRI